MDQEATTTSMEQQFAAVTAPGVSDRLRQAESGALQVMQLKRKLIHLAKRLDDNRLAIRAIGDLQLLRGRSFKLYTNDAGAMYEKAASDDVCRRLLADSERMKKDMDALREKQRYAVVELKSMLSEPISSGFFLDPLTRREISEFMGGDSN